MGDCAYNCYEIGGPWIAENPDCPVHGKSAAGDDLASVLRERLSIRVETDAPAFCGYVQITVTLMLDGKEIATSSCPLPAIDDLERAEYRDY